MTKPSNVVLLAQTVHAHACRGSIEMIKAKYYNRNSPALYPQRMLLKL